MAEGTEKKDAVAVAEIFRRHNSACVPLNPTQELNRALSQLKGSRNESCLGLGVDEGATC
ncbi:MAG: hypothetical protein V1835_05330 [Candidatus Micrarchaeota archaeon]